MKEHLPNSTNNKAQSRHRTWRDGFDSRSSRTEDLKNGAWGLSRLVLSVNGRVQGNSWRAVLSWTHHQCSIHFESSRVARDASKRIWTTKTTRGQSWGSWGAERPI